MAVSFYYIYFIVGFADSEPASFTASFATSVDGNQEIVAAALYIQCDFPVVVDDNGAYIQAMRCYRIEDRSVLQVSCKEQELKGYPFGLNEIAVLKRDSSLQDTCNTLRSSIR